MQDPIYCEEGNHIIEILYKLLVSVYDSMTEAEWREYVKRGSCPLYWPN